MRNIEYLTIRLPAIMEIREKRNLRNDPKSFFPFIKKCDGGVVGAR